MEKTLYLHIGTPKTGTTAIQAFLRENEGLLNDRGYAFPEFSYVYGKVPKERNGRFLVGPIYKGKGLRGWENEDWEKEEERLWDGLSEVTKLFETYHSVILSEEAIWHRTMNRKADLWEKLKTYSDKEGVAVKIVVYLREQGDFLWSWYNQIVKEGFTTVGYMTWNKFYKKRSKYVMLNYFSHLEKIAQWLGRENIIVRRYERSRFTQGNICYDFLEAVGITDFDRFQTAEAAKNESLTLNSVWLKQKVNNIPEMKKDDHTILRELFLEVSQKMRKYDKFSIFSEQQWKEVESAYEQENRNVVTYYLGEEGERLFAPKKSYKPKWSPDTKSMKKERKRFLRKAKRKKYIVPDFYQTLKETLEPKKS